MTIKIRDTRFLCNQSVYYTKYMEILSYRRLALAIALFFSFRYKHILKQFF